MNNVDLSVYHVLHNIIQMIIIQFHMELLIYQTLHQVFVHIYCKFIINTLHTCCLFDVKFKKFKNCIRLR